MLGGPAQQGVGAVHGGELAAASWFAVEAPAQRYGRRKKRAQAG